MVLQKEILNIVCFFETLLVTLLAVFLVMITLRPLAKLASLEHIIILDSMVIVETVILAVWACEILTWIIVSRIKKRKHCRYGEDNEGYIMKYTIAKMFQILRHNRWVSILMIIEIALGMSVFTYSLNMFFSLSREKENQKNQERDLVLEISGGEGMNDIEKQAFTLKDYEKVDEITDGQTFLYVVLPQFYSYKNENYEFVMILVDYKKA